MATSGQETIRGINIDKLAKGFADEANVFKKYLTTAKTDSREMRWYKKTSGYITGPTTTAITASLISNTASGAKPVVAEQTWTRQTSYIRKYFVESPTITIEDIRDTDIDVLGGNIRDLVIAVKNQVDQRIYTVVSDTLGTGGNANATAATATWDNATQANVNIVKDIMTAKRKIRVAGYDPSNAVMFMNPLEYEYMLTNLIFTQGVNVTDFSSEKIRSGSIMSILGVDVVVSNNATTDSVTMLIPGRSATWKQFMPITTAVIDDPGIGKKFRCWEEGEALLTDPLSVSVITNTTEAS
jgi:hypothetical protein